MRSIAVFPMLNFQLLKVGYCVHPEAIVHPGQPWRKKKFPAIIGLLKHPQEGYILFDTGYASQFHQATHSFPNRFYRWITPMHLRDNEKLHVQLNKLGISEAEIRYIFISHFHADHIAGLSDFTQAKFICSNAALKDFYARKGIQGLIKGYLPTLLPNNFSSRVIFIENLPKVTLNSTFAPFEIGYDLFTNKTHIAIALPGHAFGQFGLLYTSDKIKHFLIADACWTEKAYKQHIYPNKITNIIIANPVAYRETTMKLQQLALHNKNLNMYPSHCESSYVRWKKTIHNEISWPNS